MKVSTYINYLVNGDCSKLNIANVGDMSLNPVQLPSTVQLINQAKFLNFINLANLAIHKKFHLKKREIELDNPLNKEEYTLPSDFLSPIAAYYLSDLTPVSIKDNTTKVVDSIDIAVSILIPEPFKAIIKGTDNENRTPIIFEYSAAPVQALGISTNLNISEAYTDTLLLYAAYKAYSTISGSMQEENNTYYLRYEASCMQLTASGMNNNNEIDTNNKLFDNGFV